MTKREKRKELFERLDEIDAYDRCIGKVRFDMECCAPEEGIERAGFPRGQGLGERKSGGGEGGGGEGGRDTVGHGGSPDYLRISWMPSQTILPSWRLWRASRAR